MRYRPKHVGIAYKCDSCGEPVFLKFEVHIPAGDVMVSIQDHKLVERPQEQFPDLSYLPDEVHADFSEALVCYSNACWNAFASMCRRTIQSAAETLGVQGTSKVQHQVTELHEMGVVDEDSLKQLQQIMLTGHDGSHPHLPKIDEARTIVLLQLMKDILYQLFVRPAKIKEANDLRIKAIAERHSS